MPDDNKKAALVAEGMTEAEADYMISGGQNADGLAPDKPASEPAADPAPAQTTPAQNPAQTGDDDDEDGSHDPNAAIPYQKYSRDKKRLQSQLRERDERLNQRDTELNDLRQRYSRIDERLRVFREAIEQPQQTAQPKAPPDPDTDPIGYMRWLGERLQATEGKAEHVSSQAQERDTLSAMQETYRADARSFATRTPDFGQAYNWLMANRDAELAAAGYYDPAERTRIIAADERDIVFRAMQARQANPNAAGPAQVIYSLAKARGFAAPAASAAAPAPAAAQRPAETVTRQVENIQRGQAASRSLSSGGGAPVQQGIDLNRLSAMDDGEYLAWKRSLTPAQQRELQSVLGAPR